MPIESPFNREEPPSPPAPTGIISPFSTGFTTPSTPRVTSLAFMNPEEFSQWLSTASPIYQAQFNNLLGDRARGAVIPMELQRFYGPHLGISEQVAATISETDYDQLYENILFAQTEQAAELEERVEEREGFWSPVLEGISMGLKPVTWAGQGVVAGINAIYETARPNRLETARPDTMQRITNMFAGSEWEALHPDLQAIIWAPTVPLRIAFRLPLEYFGYRIASPELDHGEATMLAWESMTTNERFLAEEVFSGKGFDVASEYDIQQMPVTERIGRQFLSETLLDPLSYIDATARLPGMTRGVPTYAERFFGSFRPQQLSGWTVNPRTGQILDNFTTLEGGLRKPTLGEYIGWGANQTHHFLRGMFDPYGGLRRSLNAARRAGGAESVIDLTASESWQQLLTQAAGKAGISYEEAATKATMMVEEVLASDARIMRPATSSGMRERTWIEDIPISEAGTYQSRPTGGIVGADQPQQIGLFSREPMMAEGYQPLRTPFEEISGAGRAFPEEANQLRLFGTADERNAVIKAITDIEAQRVARGHLDASDPLRPLSTATTPNDLKTLTMPQLQRHLIDQRTLFVTEQAARLAGVDLWQESIRQGIKIEQLPEDITAPIYSVLEEGIPAIRGLTPEEIEPFARFLYEASFDAMNVGPRAPLMRENAAGLMTAPLDSHLGYVTHIQADEIRTTYRAAMDAVVGKTVDTRRATNEIGNIIAHGSTKQRGFPASIAEGNQMAAAARMWWQPIAGSRPRLRILPKGGKPPIGHDWIQITKMFEDDLPLIMLTRRMRGNRAIGGIQYLDDVMNKFGRYSETGRPAITRGAEPYFRLADPEDPGKLKLQIGMEEAKPTSVWDLPGMSSQRHPGAPRRPTAMWEETFGKLSPELQNRLKNTYFESPKYARAVLKYYNLSQGTGDLDSLIPVLKSIQSMARQYNLYFKAKTLFPFTSYWVRNFIDDTTRALTWVDGMKVADVGDGVKTIYRGHIPQHVKEYMGNMLGIDPSEVTVDMLLYELRKQGIFESGMFYDEIDDAVRRMIGDPDQYETGINAIERLKKHGLAGYGKRYETWMNHPANPFSTNFIVDQMGKQFGRDSSNSIRLGAAYGAMRNPDMPIDDIGLMVRQALIDYADVDPITGFLRDTGISPFITFQRHAIPQNIAAIFKKPHHVAPRVRAYRTVNDIMQKTYGEDEQPAWSDTIMYRVGRDLWFRPTNFDSLFDLGEIINGFDRFIGGRDPKAGARFVAENIGPGSEIAEQAFNYDIYSGKPIYTEAEGAKVPQFFRELGIPEEVAVRSWHAMKTSWRMARTFGTMQRVAGGDTAAIGRDLGFPVYEVDQNINNHWIIKDNTESLENFGMELGEYGWKVWDVRPDDFDKVADLMLMRLGHYYASDAYLNVDPFTGIDRPMVESIRTPDDNYITSRIDMLGRMKDDINGLFRLQDRYETLVGQGRYGKTFMRGEAPLSDGDMELLNRWLITIYSTEMGLLIMGGEQGEITEESMERRMTSRETALEGLL